MRENELRSYLSSTISLRAKLITSVSIASEKMSSYPNTKLLRNSVFPRYLINISDSDIFYLLGLKNDSIAFTTYSKTPPLYSLKESLLKLISIIALLSEDYSIEANGLFPYLVSVLSKTESIRTNIQYNLNRDPELILSSRVVSLLYTNKKLLSEINSSNKNLLKITCELILSKYCLDSNTKQIMSATGLSEPIINESLRLIQENGKKLIYDRKGNFDIVSL